MRAAVEFNLSSCSGKLTYPRWGIAVRVARRMRKASRDNKAVEPYRCKVCGSIHLGNSKVTMRRHNDVRRARARLWEHDLCFDDEPLFEVG